MQTSLVILQKADFLEGDRAANERLILDSCWKNCLNFRKAQNPPGSSVPLNPGILLNHIVSFTGSMVSLGDEQNNNLRDRPMLWAAMIPTASPGSASVRLIDGKSYWCLRQGGRREYG